MPAQFNAGEKDEVPFAIIIGTEELQNGLVTVKEQRWEVVDGKKTKIKADNEGTKVERAELVAWLKSSQIFKEWQNGVWT